MQSVSPVFTLEEVQHEREIAKNQPEYLTVIGLPVTLRLINKDDPTKTKDVPDWAIAIRFRLNDEERAAVAAGLDLVVTQLTFGKPLAPMNLQFCHSATKPVFEMRDEPLDERASEEASGDTETLSNIVQMPSSEEPANQSEQPAAEEDQPQSGV